jgi:hypothetical protein
MADVQPRRTDAGLMLASAARHRRRAYAFTETAVRFRVRCARALGRTQALNVQTKACAVKRTIRDERAWPLPRVLSLTFSRANAKVATGVQPNL